MGRTRTKDKHLPPRVYAKHGAFWYVRPAGQWVRLGESLPEAMAEWSRIVDKPTSARTMNQLFDRYMLEVAPKKAARTYTDNQNEVKALRVFFGAMRPGDVMPHHVAQFLEVRGTKAPVRANREKALLSHVFTKAMVWAVLKYNPCRGVKRNREAPRESMAQMEDLAGFLSAAPDLIRAYVLYKYCVGRRQGEILKTRLDQLREDGIHYRNADRPTKRGRQVIIGWTDELREAVAMARALPRPVRGLYLFSTRTGQPYTGDGFRSIWQRSMRKAVEDGVVKERFTEHDLRANSATDAEAQGKSAFKLLAHASRSTTETYLRSKKIEVVQAVTPPKMPPKLSNRK